MLKDSRDLEKGKWRKLDKLKENFDTEPEKEKFLELAASKCFLAYATIISKAVGIDLKIQPFHELIASAFEDLLTQQEYKKLIISAPPRAGKSFFASLFISWLVGINDSNFHILASYGRTLSNKLYRDVRSFITNPKFEELFPSFSGFEEGKKYELNGGGDILSTSVGGAMTGFTSGTVSENSRGIGAMLIDDPLKSGYSMSAMKELHDWWETQASTRRTNKYAQIIIATRFNVEDLHGFVLKKDGIYDAEKNPLGWRWINIQALCENEETDILNRNKGESFWESNPLFKRDILEGMKHSNSFSAMYQGHPVSESGGIFQKEWLKFADSEKKCYLPTKMISLDTALEDHDDACLSVISVFGITKDHSEIHLLNQISGRWGFPDLLENTLEVNKEWNPKWIVIEDASSGKSLRQVLERKGPLQGKIVKLKPIKSKSLRLQQITDLFHDGKVIFHKGDHCEPLIYALKNAPVISQWDRVDSLVTGLLYYQSDIDSGNNDSETISKVGKWNRNLKRRNIPRYNSRI